MKKSICMLLLLALALGLLTGCVQPEPDETSTAATTAATTEATEPVVSNEIEIDYPWRKEILQVYWDSYRQAHASDTPPEDSNSYYYKISQDWFRVRAYGAFGYTFVVFVDGEWEDFSFTEGTEEVAGIVFEYPSTQRLQVYRFGKFYSLQEAYDGGLLTKEDLLSLPRSFPENAYPTVSDATVAEIANTPTERRGQLLYYYENFTQEDFSLGGKSGEGDPLYLGTSEKGYVLLYGEGQLGICEWVSYGVGDFYGAQSPRVTALKDGKVWYVEDLCSRGELTDADMQRAAWLHRIHRQYNGEMF